MHIYGLMTPDELVEVVAGGESLTVEFKRATPGAINDSRLVEAVTCLANGEGGLLFLGVEDDGTVTGMGHATDRPLIRTFSKQ